MTSVGGSGEVGGGVRKLAKEQIDNLNTCGERKLRIEQTRRTRKKKTGFRGTYACDKHHAIMYGNARSGINTVLTRKKKQLIFTSMLEICK